jgi:hypothetical protein
MAKTWASVDDEEIEIKNRTGVKAMDHWAQRRIFFFFFLTGNVTQFCNAPIDMKFLSKVYTRKFAVYVA